MITLSLSKRLKQAGLPWTPTLFDFFAIPDRDMDERIFVISDISTYLGVQHDTPVIHFHGAEEWALDQIATGEIIWLPREEQIRTVLERYLLERMSLEADLPLLSLARTSSGYTCEIHHRDDKKKFVAPDASEAYGEALIFVLSQT